VSAAVGWLQGVRRLFAACRLMIRRWHGFWVLVLLHRS
jgi:hypothetical protein